MASGSNVETNRIRIFAKITAPFVAGACTECHKIPSDDVHIKSCSRCRLIWYCGKECQKKNWTYHKKFCKATSSVAADLSGPGSYLMDSAKDEVEQGEDFQDYLTDIMNAVSEALERSLDFIETKILMCPKVCEICKDANPAVLIPCKICYMVFYCSEKHANQDFVKHRKFCREYFLSLLCYHLVATKGMPLPGNMPFTIPTVSEYKPMSGTMKDYIIKSSFDPVIDACLTEYVSYPLSLIYALEHIGLKDGTKKICEVKELTILMCDAFNCIIGTMGQCFTWEYMLHLLPKLRKLNVMLVESREFYDYELDDKAIKSRTVNLCSECKSRKCKVKISIMTNYSVYKNSLGYKKPDVIFNHEVTSRDEQDAYFPYPDPEVPLVLINVFKETIEESFCVMRKMEKHDTLLPLQLNPFRAMRPIKMHMDYIEDGDGIAYSNCYIVGLRRQAKDKCGTISLDESL
ncbi:unnamed protein product [Meganyctiphanes norvegica]|uniref:MYND-type domain-containing protein n=1 Tax=Meganyctiphanes norvegica TaxID=48144 RepID=A0AAV2QYA3_MEGNR